MPRTGLRSRVSIVVSHPAIAAEWDDSSNAPLDIQKITAGSNRRVAWKCKDGHQWMDTVCNRTKPDRDSTCRWCKQPSVTEAFPDIALEFVANLTVPGRGPSAMSAQVHDRVAWRCRFDPRHQWVVQVYNRANGHGCPYCAGQRVLPDDSIARTSPALAAQFADDLNGVVRAVDLSAGSDRVVWWRCTVNPSHVWEKSVSERIRCRVGCPNCHSITETHPHLIDQWDKDSNGDDYPALYSAGSDHVATWRCKEDSRHLWSAAVKKRASGQGCPYCAGQAVDSTNSLRTLEPGLASEWHSDNGKITPDTVTAGSGQEVLWRCLEDETHPPYNAVIVNRVLQGSGCPQCAGRVPNHITSLLAVKPEIAREWDHDKNTEVASGPDAVLKMSGKRVWWRCHFNRSHRWQARIADRTRGNGCPGCTPSQSSKIETRLAFELRGFLDVEVGDKSVQVTGARLQVDVVDRTRKIAIEYDGAYWHRDNVARDQEKTARLVSAGWRVLRVREEPLFELTDDDVVVPMNPTAHVAACAVLSRLAAIGVLAVDDVTVYAAGGQALRALEADVYLGKAGSGA